jgi:fucose 4-O-acetylase-like acetyltransferase
MTDQPIANKARIDWIDAFRAIAIIAVVFWHVSSPLGPRTIIFTLPALFFISGYTLSLEKDTFQTFTGKRFRQLIIPFLSANLFVLILSFLLTQLGLAPRLLDRTVDATTLGTLVNLLITQAASTGMAGATWFLPVLFVASLLVRGFYDLLHWAGIKSVDKRLWLLTGIGLGAYLLSYWMFYVQFQPPFLLDLGLLAMLFVCLGPFARRFALLEKASRWIILTLPISIAICYYYGWIAWQLTNWPTRSFPLSPPEFLLYSVAGSLLIYWVARLLTIIPAIRRTSVYIGQRTLAILIFHFLTIKVGILLLAVIRVVPFNQAAQLTPPGGTNYWLPLTIFAVALTLGIDALLRKSDLLSLLFLGIQPPADHKDPLRTFFNSLVDSGWKETLTVTMAAAVFFILMNPQAFTAFFMGEDFSWIAIYLASGQNMLKAMLPQGPFFRPMVTFWSVVLGMPLPGDPVIFHIRNLSLNLINVLLLYQIMLLTVRWRTARLIGIGVFILSKVHLTIIGWIQSVDQAMTLMQFLVCILFLIRYLQKRRWVDYVIALIFFTLGIFARDYSVIFVLVVLILIFFYPLEDAEGSVRGKEWLRSAVPLVKVAAPFVLLAALYLVVRFYLAGLPPTVGNAENTTSYALRFEPDRIFRNSVIFAGNLFNLSAADLFPADRSMIIGRMGYGDLSTLLTRLPAINLGYLFVVLVGGTLLLVITALIGLKQRPWIAFTLAWIVLMIGPTFLVEWGVIYYAYESIAALALFVALVIDQSAARRGVLTVAWVVTLAILTLNSIGHGQYADQYSWRIVANVAEKIDQQVIQPNRGRTFKSLILVAPTKELADFIQYTVYPYYAGAGRFPMLEILFGRTGFNFKTTTPQGLKPQDSLSSSGNLIYNVTPDYHFSRLWATIPENCMKLSGPKDNFQATWVNSTQVDVKANMDLSRLPNAGQSVQVDVQAVDSKKPYYGGVELPLPKTRNFSFDFWIDHPENVEAVFVYIMNNQDNPNNAWINFNPQKSLPAEQPITLNFIPGQDNSGFTWTPKQNSGKNKSLAVFLQLKKGQQATFLIGNLCSINKTR